MSKLFREALAELGAVSDGIDDAKVDRALALIASPRRRARASWC